MWKEILFTILYWMAFNFLIYRYSFFQFMGFKSWVTCALFNTKFVAGIFIWLVYTFYYTDTARNDVHKFYSNSVALHHIAEQNPKAFTDLFFTGETNQAVNTSSLVNWNRNFDDSPVNANRFLIRINTLLLFISFHTYPVHVLFFSFFSLLGIVLFVNSVFRNVNQSNLILILPVLFMPSVLFWNSGVMKEPVLMLGIGLLLSGVINLSGKTLLKNICSIALGVLIVLFAKFFVLLCIFPAAVAYLIFKQKERRRFVVVKFAMVYLVFSTVAFSTHLFLPKVNLGQILVSKYTHAVKEAAYFSAGSVIEIPIVENNPVSILGASAVGVWNMFMRPYVWEADNPLQMFSAAENLVFLSFLLVILTFINWRSVSHINLFLFCLCFSLGYMAVTGMCTPVAGNMVRYKAPMLPLLYMAFCIAVKPKYVAASFGFLLRKNEG